MGVKNFVDNDNATAIITKIGQKFAEVDGAYVYRGSITFANIPDNLTKTMTGYVYNISDEFTTDSRFIEGAGKKYPAGTDIVVANVGSKATPDMKLDIHHGFIDVDAINNRITTAVGDLADAFDATQAYTIGAVVTHGDGLYKFKAAHTANDPWDATEVDPITVEELIASSEPDSLTTAQVNALLALLD